MKGFKIFRAIAVNLFVVALVYICNKKISEISFLDKIIPEKIKSTTNTLFPVGKFMDPFKGFWANAEPKDPSKEINLKVSGLKQPVDIIFDDRLVPHIFAQNEDDMFFTQGYITAKYRLWQMEFQTHAAAGRVSEIVGEKGIAYDQFQRRIGMLSGAETALKEIMADSATSKVMLAYTAGVNAYINDLSPQNYPLEYKILDYAPEPWTPLKTAILLKFMAFELSAHSNGDLSATNLLAKYGKATADSLLPNFFNRGDPVIPVNTKLDFKPGKSPEVPQKYDSVSVALARNLTKQEQSAEKEKKSGNGSNNWAINGRKSATGYPILANDPHLGLNLPSIWYEVQLTCPTYHVYGVSLPGAPSVVIGFNEHISWGVTNAYNDVLDFYQIQFKDDKMEEYFHDGQWKKTMIRKDTIRVRGGKEIVEDVVMTHHGPVVFNEKATSFNLSIPPKHAMRWLALDPSNEVRAFYNLNKAGNYEEFVSAIQDLVCPAQNFVYADNQNNIAMWVNGKMPLRWKEQGKYILDGTKSAYDWQSWIPREQVPHVKNPTRNFVSSANQFSTDTLSYPYYLGWDYPSPERGMRINEKLSSMSKITVDDLQDLQNDNMNLLAQYALPVLLKHLNQNNLKGKYARAYETLNKWKFQNNADMISPTIFDVWWDNLQNAIWQDNISSGMHFPEYNKTLLLITQDTLSHWFDNVNTLEKENIHNIINQSFQTTVNFLEKKHGEQGEAWQWGKYKNTQVRHLLKIKGFGAENLMVGGGETMVNATKSTHGPSWRMIVSMGETVQGYGIYPGGQSGNPGSYFYDDMIERWRLGELAEILFMKTPESKSPKIISKMKLEQD